MTLSAEALYLSEPGPQGLFTRLTRVGLLLDGFQHRVLDSFGLRFIDFSVLRERQGERRILKRCRPRVEKVDAAVRLLLDVLTNADIDAHD